MAAPNELGQRSVSAVIWGAGGSALRILIQLGSQVVLARILGPDQYGLFAIGAVVIGFSNFFSDIGLAYGLIQKPALHAEDIRFVFTWQIVLGVAVSGAIAVCAPLIAGFFGDPRAAGVVGALAVVCLLNAAAAPALNLLKRDLDFRRIQIAQLASYVAGYVLVGIPLALQGAQVWALVAAWLIQAGSMLVLLQLARRHPVRPLLWFDGARALSGYGAMVLLTNLTNWLIGNIDRVIMGRAFASRELGLYATSYNILYTPASTLLGVIQPVFFSAASRVADDRARIESGYRALLGALAVFVLPAFASLAMVAATFVDALYGAQWQGAAVLLQPLALAMPLLLLWGVSTPLFWSGGHVGREFLLQLPVAVAWALACWLAAQHSIVAMAWTVLGLFALRAALVVAGVVRLLRLNPSGLVREVAGGLLLSVVVAACVAFVDSRLNGLAPMPRLALDILCGGGVLLGLLRLLPGLIGPALAELIGRHLLHRCPPALATRLAFLRRAAE